MAEIDITKSIAEELHTLKCRYNHTDGCGWLYEQSPTYLNGTWTGWAHKKYLEQAKELIERAPLVAPDFIHLVLTLINEKD